MRKLLALVMMLPLTGSVSVLAGAQASEADAVYKNGFVYTVDAVRIRAQAFAVRDGKFLAVGTNDDMKAVTGKDTRVVDLKGQMVMPGLVDTHIHALRGALTALGLAFPVTSSVDEIKAAVKKYIADKKLKKGEWVEGAKWEHDYKKLNAKMLDEVSDDEITGFNIPCGVPLAYELDDDLKPISREFLGDPEEIAKAAAAVAAQGKAQ